MRILISTFLLLALSLAPALSAAAGPADGKASGDKPAAAPADGGQAGEDEAAAEKPLRFTNADLPSLGPRDRARLGGLKEASEDGEEPAEGEAESGFDEAVAQLEEEGRRQGIEETRKEIVMLETRLEHLQARLLSVQNPLLKRVTPATEEEEAAVGGLSNDERLQWVEDQIAATEQDLLEAREQLSTLLRR